MARKRSNDPSNQTPTDSRKWPNLFAVPSQARSLVEHPAFPRLVADLMVLREALVFDVIHNTTTMEATNFARGHIAVCDRVAELSDDLTMWEQEHR